MKYIKGGSIRSISSSNTPPGTSIWNSCRKSIEFFTQQLFRIPGNGKSILLQEEKISDNPPLSFALLLTEILNWEKNKGLIRLVDIYSWDCSGNWTGWSLRDLPVGLVPPKNMLLNSLSGLSLIHISQKDIQVWGHDGFYTAAKGFIALLPPHYSSFPPAIWKTVWFSLCQPKGNFFTWLVLNKNILTGDSLSK